MDVQSFQFPFSESELNGQIGTGAGECKLETGNCEQSKTGKLPGGRNCFCSHHVSPGKRLGFRKLLWRNGLAAGSSTARFPLDKCYRYTYYVY
jgi:hypothetical protein